MVDIKVMKAIKILSRKGGLTAAKLKRKLGETSNFLFNYGLITPHVVHIRGNKTVTVYHLRWTN